MNKRFAVIRVAASKARAVLADKALIVGVALSAPLLSHAQTDPFATSVTAITEKVETYGAALVGVAAAAVVFMVGIKYVKKIARAA